MQKQIAKNGDSKGITLIALVITIIVLLILAGVTISMVLGDDGIIAQATQAKTAQEEAEKEEQDEIRKGEGNIDLYTEGTVANMVEVGDYVIYNYDAPDGGYTTPAKGTGKEINDEQQTFHSKEGGNVEMTKWRVLSKDNGVVKLIGERVRKASTNEVLKIKGATGYLNGVTVLNEMCEKLYSSDIGIARSINVDDVNKITGYDGAKFYIDKDGSKVRISANKKVTIGELENDETLGLGKISNRNTPDGKPLEDYENDLYYYEVLKDTEKLTEDSTEYKMLFKNFLNFGGNLSESSYSYWLASRWAGAVWTEEGGYVGFSMRMVTSAEDDMAITIADNQLFDSNGESDYFENRIRPIVTLKTGVQVEKEKEKIVLDDGVTEVEAWKIKGN